MTKWIAGLGIGAALAFAAPTTAQAQEQDGLVNIVVGDVTIAENVQISAVVGVVATVCAIIPANITLLATQVDNTSRNRLVCRTEDGDMVRIVQNN